MEGAENFDVLFTAAEDCIEHALPCILEEDSIRLNSMIAELTDYKNLFSNISASVDDLTVKAKALQFLNYFSEIFKEAEHILAQHEGETLNISLPLEAYSGFGRPKKIFPIEQILELRNTGLSWSRIARLLGVSARTLKRHRASLNLVDGRRRTILSDDELDLMIREIKSEHPASGYVYVWSALKAKEVFITYKRLKERLKLIDPVGIFIRSRKRISRRKYKVKGAQYLWHMDGNEKLVSWRMYIHGCVDGYSRKIIYLSLAHNKTAQKVLNIFKQGVDQNGMPIRVRGDGGSENVLVNEFMHTSNAGIVSPFIIGRSVHNVRIERLWAEVNRVVSSKYRSIFFELEDLELLDELSALDLLCLSYVYFNRIDQSLQNFVSCWNDHPLSSHRSYTPNQIWLMSFIEQSYSNNVTRTVSAPTGNDQLLPGPQENNPLQFNHLLDFVNSLPLEAIQTFESEAMEIVPDPLIDDGHDGKVLYSMLRNHFVTD